MKQKIIICSECKSIDSITQDNSIGINYCKRCGGMQMDNNFILNKTEYPLVFTYNIILSKQITETGDVIFSFLIKKV